MPKKIIIAIAGSSGSMYAKRLLDKLKTVEDLKVAVVMTDNALINWKLEIGDFDQNQYPFDFYAKNDFNAPFASGSAQYNYMVVVPCSMGMLARIAQGISNDLITRAADVVLKERRKCILLTRETPLSLIHINNMKTFTEAGGIIMPACPSFYQDNISIDSIIDSVVDRLIDHLDINNNTYRWGE